MKQLTFGSTTNLCGFAALRETELPSNAVKDPRWLFYATFFFFCYS